jgi:hypothetical protein
MRTATYVHPGEQLSCVGCHEDKWQATPLFNPTATRRQPSQLQPEVGAETNGVTPINFYRLVKPVFDAHCTSCHQQKNAGPNMSYTSLQNYAFWLPGPGTPYVDGDIITALHGGSRSTPGQLGAHGATLTKYCDSTHYNVHLTQAELRRITLWLDANSNELCAYTHVTEQRNGQLEWPELDFDPALGTGVEHIATPVTREIGHSQLPTSELFVLRGNCLDLVNPISGAIHIRIFNANGKAVGEWLGMNGKLITIKLPSGRGLYFVALYGPNQKPLRQLQVVRL